MTLTFKPAVQTQGRARVALVGPAGAGKTYTMLALATAMGKRVGVIDTEHGSAAKYANLFPFDSLELDTFDPRTYTQAIEAAGAAGYDVLGIDSLSHAWMGKGGALEMIDTITARERSHNSYTAWRDVTPIQNAMIEAILQSPCHIIATMRSKTEYVMEQNDRGKTVPRKVGLAPIQRDNVDYEFDVVGELDNENTLVVTKTRCPALTGAVIKKPGETLAKTLLGWLSDGVPIEQPRPTSPVKELLHNPEPDEKPAPKPLGSPVAPPAGTTPGSAAKPTPEEIERYDKGLAMARAYPAIDLAPYERRPEMTQRQLLSLMANLGSEINREQGKLAAAK